MTTATLKFEATFEANTVNLAKIRTFIRETTSETGADDSTLDEFELAVDEACTNVIEHGYQGQVEGRTIRIEVTSSRRAIVITIIDQSAEFDPGSVPLPDLDQVRRDLQVGGLGLFLVRTLMDDVSYERMLGEPADADEEGWRVGLSQAPSRLPCSGIGDSVSVDPGNDAVDHSYEYRAKEHEDNRAKRPIPRVVERKLRNDVHRENKPNASAGVDAGHHNDRAKKTYQKPTPRATGVYLSTSRCQPG